MLQGQLDSVRDQEQKVLVWNKENRNGVRGLYVKDERIMVTWGQLSMKQECRDKGWNKGNRDKWRGVSMMGIEWTWGWKRYSRGRWHGVDFVRDPLVIWYLTTVSSSFWRLMSLASSSVILELACTNFSSAFQWQFLSLQRLFPLLIWCCWSDCHGGCCTTRLSCPTQRMPHLLYGKLCTYCLTPTTTRSTTLYPI